jgi:hypothetical protein
MIESPADNALQNTPTVTLAGKAEPGAAIEVLEGGHRVASVAADGSGAWLATLQDVSDGSHMYAAVARDAAGNASSPATRTVRVDTTGPAVTIEGDAGRYTLAVSEAGARLECRVDGGPWASCSGTVGYALGSGFHVLEARATDVLGNTGPVARREWTVAAPLVRSTIALSIRRQSLGTVLRKGLKIRAGCTSMCRLSVVVTRRRSVVARRSLSKARPGEVTLALSHVARRSLDRLRRVPLVIAVSAPHAATVRRHVTLTR